MLISHCNSRYGYETLKELGIPGAVPSAGQEAPNHARVVELHSTMFLLMCAYPVVLSIVQIISWSMFKLRSSHAVESKYVDM